MIILLSTLIVAVSAKSLEVNGGGCRTEFDENSLTKCLRPWMSTWEKMRSRNEEELSNLYPIFYFRRDEVLALCDVYIEKLDTCLSDRIVASCENNTLYQFVQQQIGYVCGPQAVEVLSQFECLGEAIKSKPECRAMISGDPAPGQSQEKRCSNVPAYFNCLQGTVLSSCGARGIAIIAQALQQFGCDPNQPPVPVTKHKDVQALDNSIPVAELPDEEPLFPEQPELPELPVRGSGSVAKIRRGLNAPVLREDQEENNVQIELPQPPLLNQHKEGLSEFITDSTIGSEEDLDFDAENFLDSGIGFQLNLRTPDVDSEIKSQPPAEFLEKPAEVLLLETPSSPNGLDLESDGGEVEGSGEEPRGRFMPPSAKGSMEVEGRCSVTEEARIVACYAPLSQKWDEISDRKPEMKETLFPLFTYSTTDLLGLCDVLQATLDDCLDDEMLADCAKHPIMHFVDGLLGFACGRHKTDFFLTFDCIHGVATKHPECNEHIKGQPKSGLSRRERCDGMGAYVGCIQTNLSQTCTPDSMKMFLSSVQHFGCDINGRIIETQPGPPVEVFLKPALKLRKQSEELFTQDELQKFGVPTLENPHRVGAPPYGVPPPPVENSHPIISSFCTPRIRDKVRTCLRPLFVNWLRYRTSNPQLNNVTYPIWFYEKEQVLEMCDLYASAFIDCDFPLFDVCLTDEIVRFANNHLGYICSPSKITLFMNSFSCTAQVLRRSANECLNFIQGPSEPGNDLHRCVGMSSFYDCAISRVESECGVEGAAQLLAVVSQFGCDLARPNAVNKFARIRKLA